MSQTLYSRRQFASRLLGGAVFLGFSSSLMGKELFLKEEDIVWHNVEDWGIEGKGWNDTLRYFDRLPSKAEGVVREPVWNLSRQSAGMSVRFTTDSPDIYVRYSLLKSNLAMNHMPATGVSGIDLYAEDSLGEERWVAVTRPNEQEIEGAIAKGLAPGNRHYTMYLPLYNGVEKLEIGIPKGNGTFTPIAPRTSKPILFYGTSILHGACASRPGMAFPSILSRRLKRPILNLGFSGNGRMEAEVAELLAEQNPSAFVVDCLPNMNAEMVSERTAPLVNILRKAHKKTPILLVEDRSFTNSAFFPSRQNHHKNSRAALRKVHQELLDAGVENLFYLNGSNLLGTDGEAATDGSHPNDLGMVRYADAYEPVLKQMLKLY